MGFSNALFGSLEIVNEANKIKGKTIPRLRASFFILSSTLFLSNLLLIEPLVSDFSIHLNTLITTSPTPGSPDFPNLIISMIDELRIFAGEEWIFLVSISFAFIFFEIATILSSAAEYCEQQFVIEDLQVRIIKTWKRTFVTLFYTTLLDLGYAFFVLAFFLPLLMISNSKITITCFSILIFILAVLFRLYLATVWTLALVVSILEEKSGIEALGKAGQLVKGLELKGFFLKLMFETIYYVMLMLFTWISNKQSMFYCSLVFLPFFCLVKMFSFVVFTVFYFESKKANGEEVELQGTDLEYTDIPTKPLLDAEIP